jgi:hypothetical protein
VRQQLCSHMLSQSSTTMHGCVRGSLEVSPSYGLSEINNSSSRKRSQEYGLNQGPLSSYRNSQQGQHRTQENGIFVKRTAMKVYIRCENFPVWLPCVDKLSCNGLYIMGFACKEDLLTHVKSMGHPILFLTHLLEVISGFCPIEYCFHMPTDPE